MKIGDKVLSLDGVKLIIIKIEDNGIDLICENKVLKLTYYCSTRDIIYENLQH